MNNSSLSISDIRNERRRKNKSSCIRDHAVTFCNNYSHDIVINFPWKSMFPWTWTRIGCGSLGFCGDRAFIRWSFRSDLSVSLVVDLPKHILWVAFKVPLHPKISEVSAILSVVDLNWVWSLFDGVHTRSIVYFFPWAVVALILTSCPISSSERFLVVLS